jgi:hypothetical protein
LKLDKERAKNKIVCIIGSKSWEQTLFSVCRTKPPGPSGMLEGYLCLRIHSQSPEGRREANDREAAVLECGLGVVQSQDCFFQNSMFNVCSWVGGEAVMVRISFLPQWQSLWKVLNISVWSCVAMVWTEDLGIGRRVCPRRGRKRSRSSQNWRDFYSWAFTPCPTIQG